MPHRAARFVFDYYAQELEHHHEFWGLRLFIGLHDGLVWHGPAIRNRYAAHGFTPMATMPWRGARSYFNRRQLAHLNAIYRKAFHLAHRAKGLPPTVTEKIQFGNHAGIQEVVIDFMAVHGNLRHGVVLTRSRLDPPRLAMGWVY